MQTPNALAPPRKVKYPISHKEISMYIIIWEFQVETEQLIDFETAYASNGTWEE